MTEIIYHEPVMLQEVINNLRLRDGMILLDATLGTGGHALELLKRISPGGKLIGIDRDAESLEIAKERLRDYQSQCIFIHGNFCNIDTILKSCNISAVDGVLLDLGISSFQLDNAVRGFSFVNEGPLDMRMDRSTATSAFDLLQNLTREEIAAILWQFGQERFSRRIAARLVEYRDDTPISTTTQLARLIAKSVPRRAYHRIHPATRAFQALRIAVNHELESLELFLQRIAPFVRSGGRLCAVSFHSLEDRIIKVSFRDFVKNKGFIFITKKPLPPQEQEIRGNPRARSAKLRVVEKC